MISYILGKHETLKIQIGLVHKVGQVKGGRVASKIQVDLKVSDWQLVERVVSRKECLG